MAWKKGSNIIFPSYNIEAVGKNIKWEKGKGTEISRKKIRLKINRGGEEYKVIGNYIQYTPLP